MALTTKEMLSRTEGKYHLTRLVGGEPLDHIVTWVHMLEDTSVAEFFWGNELVVSCGYSAKDEAGLTRFLDELAVHRCAGVVLNTGKYIGTVPEAVVEHCREIGLPLFTMPWQMSMTEFVRECCSQINKSSRDDDELAEAALRVIHSPSESGADQAALGEVFAQERGFQMLAIGIAAAGLNDESRAVLHQRMMLRLHTAMRPFSFGYLAFRHRSRYFLLLNQSDRAAADKAAQRVLSVLPEGMKNLTVTVGVGEPVAALQRLESSYHSAISAHRRAELQGQPMVRFRDMGFYKLLYSVPDDALLQDYYRELLTPVLDSDSRSGTVYTETLFRYLLADGSLQEVAAQMYTHRNTVNYRMAKIRELLDCPLETTAQRLPYLIAYHAGVILRLTEDLEE